MKKELQRNLSFVLFVMAVFFAGMSLTVFQSYIWMACIAGVLLLATAVFYVLSKEKDTESPVEKTSDILLADRMAELMRGNEKAEKGVYIAVKKQHEAMESGLATLEEKLDELVKAQESAVKTLVMYNKENAKQMALSERDELGRLRQELKQLQQGGGALGASSAVVDAVREMSHRLYEEMHENSEAILAELGTTVDCLEEMKEIVDSLSDGGTIRVVVPESEEQADEEKPEYPFVLPEESEEDMFAASGVDLSDPNRALSADDIAALFAQANGVEAESEPVVIQEEEPAENLSRTEDAVSDEETAEEKPEDSVSDEETAEEKPEDALASSGVDLSDPNRTLSADDIAALIAAMGN